MKIIYKENKAIYIQSMTLLLVIFSDEYFYMSGIVPCKRTPMMLYISVEYGPLIDMYFLCIRQKGRVCTFCWTFCITFSHNITYNTYNLEKGIFRKCQISISFCKGSQFFEV